MPREKKSLAGSNEPQPQEEMTVVVMRFRGSGDTLQKGFDTVSQALAALGPPQPPVQQRVLVQRPAAQLPAGPDVIDAEAREAEDDEFEPAAAEPAASNGRPKRVYEPRKYSFLPDFNVSPADMPFKQFIGDRPNLGEYEKYILASAWIMRHGSLDTFTPNHVFTCFRAMQWKQQVDFSQPMRQMKAKKSYFETPTKGTWRLTGIGLEEADHILAAN
jgi:hypothetical protein